MEDEREEGREGGEKKGSGIDVICLCISCVAGVLRVCCSVLQCVAVCCGVLHCIAVCCTVLQLWRVSSRTRDTGSRILIGSLIFIGHFPQK